MAISSAFSEECSPSIALAGTTQPSSTSPSFIALLRATGTGMAAAVVAGWGKPVAAFLIIILFVTGAPILAVLIGVGIGWVAITLLPLPEPEAAPEPAAATSE